MSTQVAGPAQIRVNSGWTFRREAAGAVRVTAPCGVDVVIDADTWAQAAAVVSTQGESAARWRRARAFHTNPFHNVHPGQRFALTISDGTVCYRGILHDDGGAELDVSAGRVTSPRFLLLQELLDIYDPTVHTVTAIEDATQPRRGAVHA